MLGPKLAKAGDPSLVGRESQGEGRVGTREVQGLEGLGRSALEHLFLAVPLKSVLVLGPSYCFLAISRAFTCALEAHPALSLSANHIPFSPVTSIKNICWVLIS